MARRRVIAYPMHEGEMAECGDRFEDATVTEAFQIGFLDDADIDALRDRGIVVEILEGGAGAATASVARRSAQLDDAVVAVAEPDPPAPGEMINLRLRLHGPLLEEIRSVIDGTSGEVAEALGRFEYLVVGTTDTADALAGTPGVDEVVRHTGQDAAAVPLRTAADRSPGDAVLTDDVSGVESGWDAVFASARWAGDAAGWLAGRGVVVDLVGTRMLRLPAGVGPDVLAELVHRPGVVSVVEHVEPETQNDRARALVGVEPLPRGLEGLDGSGEVVAVADTGVDESHPDLTGRLVGVRAYGRLGAIGDPDGHGTHVAATIAGGSTGRAHAGIAPGARLYVQSLYAGPGAPIGGLPADVGELLADALAAGARIHNDSWGAHVRGAYDSRAAQIDEFVDQHPGLLVVVAAGNEGDASAPRVSPAGYPDAYSITSPGTSKNALTVGASRSDRAVDATHGDRWPTRFPNPPLASAPLAGDPDALAGFSSRGPCDDERLKPDVVAPGTCIVSARSSTAPDSQYEFVVDDPDAGGRWGSMSGTSMAAPVVSGIAALVRQYYREERHHDASAALVKATIINGARHLGGPDANLDPAGMPNSHQGFGCVDLAASLPDDDRRLVFVDTWCSDHLQHAFDRTGQRVRFRIPVERAGLPLRVALVWTDRPGRSAQQDLGLFVELPDGTKRIGNESRAHRAYETDVVNTVEVVTVDDAPTGTYLCNVIARSLAFVDRPQHYALVVCGGVEGDLQRAGIY